MNPQISMASPHSFHIPVMGIGFTVDTPLKVSHLGIDSVISLVDDHLLERLRKVYSEPNGLAYEAIPEEEEDARALRITAYLDMLNVVTRRKFESMLQSGKDSLGDISAYFDLLPDASELKEQFRTWVSENRSSASLKSWLRTHLTMGSIDVNIMTKVDKTNHRDGAPLPTEFNDAHAALRGYANSSLDSMLVLSAGMSPRLYGYLANFDDFYPDRNGHIRKRVALKVSDYRSALIQGKFLAKKGIWVSEYRIESGLNCGGHAFATDGFLMGPILQEFRDNREDLIASVHAILVQALSQQDRIVPEAPLEMRVTAQGGVGTAEEHSFLVDTYGIDSVGWGSPFLLVDEATSVDEPTRDKLAEATEKDLYLSGISPLGVPFNNLRGNSKDESKRRFVEKGRPGSSCPKKYLASNVEFTENPICTASRQYQHLKLKEISALGLSENEYQLQHDTIVEKSCICVGLGTSALLVNNLDTRVEGPEVSICPGPNMAYFDRKLSLRQMVDHIYGRENVISRTDRPHMFVKELSIYLDYLVRKVDEMSRLMTNKSQKYLLTFSENLEAGMNYYRSLFSELGESYELALKQIDESAARLGAIKEGILEHSV
jgi:hypothetical protein